MPNIAIFASGTGTNARAIIEHFKGHPRVKVNLIVSNKKDAGVLTIADNNNVPSVLINRQTFFNSSQLLTDLNNHEIDFIVLAGFLWLIPEYLIQAFPNKIINIHPSLLPKYGGKGMYGSKVHQAVIANKESKSGITIHYVNDRFDEGEVIFQVTCEVLPEDTPATLAQKIHRLEHQHFPKVIESLLT